MYNLCRESKSADQGGGGGGGGGGGVNQDNKMSCIMRKPDFCLCENKDENQLRSNCTADQRLCFRYMDSIIP